MDLMLKVIDSLVMANCAGRSVKDEKGRETLAKRSNTGT